MVGLRQRQAREREARIVRAAEALFSRKNGYRRTSMQEIAKRSKLAVGTLYNYFPSKPKILLAIVARDTSAGTECRRRGAEAPSARSRTRRRDVDRSGDRAVRDARPGALASARCGSDDRPGAGRGSLSSGRELDRPAHRAAGASCRRAAICAATSNPAGPRLCSIQHSSPGSLHTSQMTPSSSTTSAISSVRAFSSSCTDFSPNIREDHHDRRRSTQSTLRGDWDLCRGLHTQRLVPRQHRLAEDRRRSACRCSRFFVAMDRSCSTICTT